MSLMSISSIFMSTMKKKDIQLLFVYNANSGTQNAVLDSMHKVFSSSTYQCSLCDITFGVVSENKIWKKFREESELDLKFLHKDEFLEQYSEDVTFPIALKLTQDGMEVFISAEELNLLKGPEELINLVVQRTKT